MNVMKWQQLHTGVILSSDITFIMYGHISEIQNYLCRKVDHHFQSQSHKCICSHQRCCYKSQMGHIWWDLLNIHQCLEKKICRKVKYSQCQHPIVLCFRTKCLNKMICSVSNHIMKQYCLLPKLGKIKLTY